MNNTPTTGAIFLMAFVNLLLMFAAGYALWVHNLFAAIATGILFVLCFAISIGMFLVDS